MPLSSFRFPPYLFSIEEYKSKNFSPVFCCIYSCVHFSVQYQPYNYICVWHCSQSTAYVCMWLCKRKAQTVKNFYFSKTCYVKRMIYIGNENCLYFFSKTDYIQSLFIQSFLQAKKKKKDVCRKKTFVTLQFIIIIISFSMPHTLNMCQYTYYRKQLYTLHRLQQFSFSSRVALSSCLCELCELNASIISLLMV